MHRLIAVAFSCALVALGAFPARAQSTPGVVVLALHGDATPERRTLLQDDLVVAFGKQGYRADEDQANRPYLNACHNAAAQTLIGGTINTLDAGQFGGPHDVTATFDLDVYDCTGKVVLHRRFERQAQGPDAFVWSIGKCADAAVTGFVQAARAAAR